MSTALKGQICAICSLGWFVVGAGITRMVGTTSHALSISSRLDETCKRSVYVDRGSQMLISIADNQAPSFYWVIVEARS
ncbi:hypothetical protein F4780DRAFT_736845 [Xylariomycetidae sp. FL0641]|nr:hypothetical protein F4780DRAFT_736845 [Xylariomycetidae sp. FL0641]